MTMRPLAVVSRARSLQRRVGAAASPSSAETARKRQNWPTGHPARSVTKGALTAIGGARRTARPRRPFLTQTGIRDGCPTAQEAPVFVHTSRRTIATVLGLLAAAAAVWSAFLSWYRDREGTNIRIQDLFSSGITLNNASTMTSLFLPLAFAALLCVVYAAIGWRWPMVLGGLICIATCLLWGTRQAQTLTGLHAALVGHGAQLAAAAGAVMIIAAAVAPPRRHREPATTAEPAAARTGDNAYTAGYNDARAAADTPTTPLTGHRRASARQQPTEPRTRHDDPNP